MRFLRIALSFNRGVSLFLSHSQDTRLPLEMLFFFFFFNPVFVCCNQYVYYYEWFLGRTGRALLAFPASSTLSVILYHLKDTSLGFVLGVHVHTRAVQSGGWRGKGSDWRNGERRAVG